MPVLALSLTLLAAFSALAILYGRHRRAAKQQSEQISHLKAREEELSAALQSAEQAAASKASFLANMSHEIRTPMNGVIGFTELLMKSDMSDEQFAQVQLISDSGRAMMRLLDDILDVSKIESGELRILLEPTDLRQQLQHCAKLHEPMARGKGLSLSTFVDSAVPKAVIVDRLRLRQIVLNLIGNAVKFTERGGIDIDAQIENSSDGQVLLISVIDTGIGIANEKLETIFQPFTQEDSSPDRNYGGAGLGLAISSQLATIMDGHITVHSKLSVGTSFSLRLPLQDTPGIGSSNGPTSERADGPTSEPTADIEAPAKSPLRDLSGAKILIAEDDAINKQLIVEMTASFGIRAETVTNGEEAVIAVVEATDAGRPFNAVLMDMQMPEVDGLEATKRLRMLGYDAKKLPIIALTANCYPEDAQACAKAGMQSHLGKPVTTIALARELARWLGPDFENEPILAGASAIDPAIDPNATSATPPSSALAGLEERYRERRDHLVDSLRDSLRADPAQTDWETLAGELHKLAGIAANFGDVALGEASRRLEMKIKSAKGPRSMREALRHEWPVFDQAA